MKPRKKPYHPKDPRYNKGKPKGLPPSGCAAQKAKLTREQVIEIKKILLLEKYMRAKDGRTMRPRGMRIRIAERYGISVSMVKRFIEGKRHKYVKVQLWGPAWK